MGLIYLIRTAVCVANKEPVFKIGKTKFHHTRNRFSAYDKNGEIYYVRYCAQENLMEQWILQAFRKRFIREETRHGKEYFRGSVFEMIEVIEEIFQRRIHKRHQFMSPSSSDLTIIKAEKNESVQQDKN